MARFTLAAIAAVAFMLAPPAQAAEVTALITNALKSTLTELTPAFEKTSEHKLNATYGSTEPLKVRVEKDEPIDVAVIGTDAIDQLLKQNKYDIPANIEFEYEGDPVVEVGKCLQYCREALA